MRISTTLRFPSHPIAWLPALAASLLTLLATACGPQYPSCDDDGDCHEGEFCVNGQCQLCRDDADCPAGQSCNGGRCDPIEGYCTGTGDCPDGQECQDNRCVTSASTDVPAPVESTPSAGSCSLSAVEFAFDEDELSAGARDTLQANARCIRERGIGRLHLTGHCDPRGTEEYNLALGDRRARTVKSYLVSLGVSADGISTSSMGEEMATGEDEVGWRRDRRVDFAER